MAPRAVEVAIPAGYHELVAAAVSRYVAPDRCPYHRPFDEGFDGCPAYQAVSFTVFDSLGQKGGTWLTCRHLTSGDHYEQSGRFYPRCALGTSDDRIRWLARVTQSRLEVVRALQHEFDSFSQTYREQLLQAKVRWLGSPATPELRDNLERLLAVFRDAVRRFLADRKARFGEVGLPIEPLMQLVEAGSRAWAASLTLRGPDGELTGLRVFDPQFQAFLAEAVETPWRQSPGEASSIYEDPILRISRRSDPAGLRFDGTIDASNSEAVSQALRKSVAGAHDYHVDMTGLLFCDAGGMRAIVEVAEQLEDGGRIFLDGVPTHFGKVAALAGWRNHPNLVFAPAPAEKP